MTDITELSRELFRRIEWQNVPNDMTREDLSSLIAYGIRFLYVQTGRALEFSESMFTLDGELYTEFSDDLRLDEREYVLLTAEIDFYRKVQTSVSDLTSYTTDAMSVTHGDKPFANIQQKLVDLESQRRMIWYKMIRFHLL